MLLYICYVLHYIEIIIAVHTLKGTSFIAGICTEKLSKHWVMLSKQGVKLSKQGVKLCSQRAEQAKNEAEEAKGDAEEVKRKVKSKE